MNIYIVIAGGDSKEYIQAVFKTECEAEEYINNLENKSSYRIYKLSEFKRFPIYIASIDDDFKYFMNKKSLLKFIKYSDFSKMPKGKSVEFISLGYNSKYDYIIKRPQPSFTIFYIDRFIKKNKFGDYTQYTYGHTHLTIDDVNIFKRCGKIKFAEIEPDFIHDIFQRLKNFLKRKKENKYSNPDYGMKYILENNNSGKQGTEGKFIEGVFDSKKDAEEYLKDHPNKDECELFDLNIEKYPFYIIKLWTKNEFICYLNRQDLLQYFKTLVYGMRFEKDENGNDLFPHMSVYYIEKADNICEKGISSEIFKNTELNAQMVFDTLKFNNFCAIRMEFNYYKRFLHVIKSVFFRKKTTCDMVDEAVRLEG